MKNWFLIGLLCMLLTGCGLIKTQKRAGFTPEETARLDQKLGEVGPSPMDKVESLPLTPLEAIRNAFDENPLKAGSLYGGKWIKTQGALAFGPVKKTVAGLNSFTLVLDNNGKQIAVMFLGGAKEEQMRSLKKGQIITVVGQYSKDNTLPFLSLAKILSIENQPTK